MNHELGPQHLDRHVSVPWGWVVFAALLVLQFLLFYHRAEREVTWAYPTRFDQTGYLSGSYETFEEIRQRGVIAGVLHGFTVMPWQGKLLHVQAAVLYLFLGASRSSALTLNFIYFALLQFFVLYTARWLTKRWSVGWIAVGLLLATTTRFNDAGGLLDFRIDLIASCLMGIMVCILIRSGVFRYLAWSLAAGFAAGVLIDFRFLATVLVFPLWVFVLAYLMFRAGTSGNSRRIRTLALGRIRRLLIAGALTLMMTLPAIWHSWAAIKLYYFTNQMVELKQRLAEYGVNTATDFVMYYPKSLLSDHLGPAYLALSIVLAALVLASGWRAENLTPGLPRFTRQACVTLCWASLAVPLFVLTVWPSKNPVVATMLTAPALACTLLVLFWLAARIGQRLRSSLFARSATILAAVAMTIGGFVELNGATKPGLPPGARSEYQAVSAFYDELGAYCERNGLLAPKLVFDRMWDYLHPTLFAPFYYERHGVFLKPKAAIGEKVLAISDQEAADALVQSDIAVLTEPSSPNPPGSVLPYNDSMKGRYAMLRGIAGRELVPVRQFRLFSQDLTLYVRPSARVECTPNEWITSSGTSVRASADMLRIRPTVELTGRTSLMEFLGDKIGVHAVVTVGSRVFDELNTSFKTVEYYRIVLRLNPEKLPAAGDVVIRLTFDKYVVPKKAGLNNDTRELVLMAPTRVRLLAADQP